MFLPVEEEIRQLCAKVIRAQSPTSFESALAELKSALREHMIEAENKSIHLVLEMKKIPEKLRSGTKD